jgi:hypothetical protein
MGRSANKHTCVPFSIETDFWGDIARVDHTDPAWAQDFAVTYNSERATVHRGWRIEIDERSPKPANVSSWVKATKDGYVVWFVNESMDSAGGGWEATLASDSREALEQILQDWQIRGTIEENTTLVTYS